MSNTPTSPELFLRTLTVIETKFLRPSDEDIDGRRITQYWDLEGHMLAEVDPHASPDMPCKLVGHRPVVPKGDLFECRHCGAKFRLMS